MHYTHLRITHTHTHTHTHFTKEQPKDTGVFPHKSTITTPWNLLQHLTRQSPYLQHTLTIHPAGQGVLSREPKLSP